MISKNTLQNIFHLIQNGEDDQAMILIKTVKERESLIDYAEFIHLLGIQLFQNNMHEKGIEFTLQALEVIPDMYLYHSNLTEMYRQMSILDKSIMHGRLAIKYNPQHAECFTNLGIALFDSEEYEEAILMQNTALSLNPNCLPALNNLGSIYHKLKDYNQAIIFYNKVLSINPQYLESMNNLGTSYTFTEDYDSAKKYFAQVLKSQPQNFETLTNLGQVFFSENNYHQAEILFRRALQINPKFNKAVLGLASTLDESNFTKEAIVLLENYSDSQDTDILVKLAELYNSSGRNTDAKKILDSLINNESKTSAQLLLAQIYTEEGDDELAKNLIHNVLTIDPKDRSALCVYISNNKITSLNDPHLTRLIDIQENEIIYTADEKISIHYALGKAFDDIHEYDRAFHHFQQGAQIKSQKIDYDAKKSSEYINRIIAVFSKDNITKWKQCTASLSHRPIFILGMPRSGTTLTEQIIASHSSVFGGGELSFFQDHLKHFMGENENEYPEMMMDLDAHSINTLAEMYLQSISKLNSDMLFLTDKMPNNYLVLGLIAIAFPQAKIIHTQRNPYDTCLSNFTRLFKKDAQPASYNLSDLSQSYNDYHQLMNHWRNVLPENTFYELEYERLVNDIDAESRKLLDYCQLDWEDGCLEFYKLKRSVRTASVNQVRKPIYKSSVARWKNYEAHLQDLVFNLTLT